MHLERRDKHAHKATKHMRPADFQQNIKLYDSCLYYVRVPHYIQMIYNEDIYYSQN